MCCDVIWLLLFDMWCLNIYVVSLSLQAAQAQRRAIEKFIGDRQAVEVTNARRQRELLDRTVQELAARGAGFMCRPEMRALDDMLAQYRCAGNDSGQHVAL
jgi:hypothetical protein